LGGEKSKTTPTGEHGLGKLMRGGGLPQAVLSCQRWIKGGGGGEKKEDKGVGKK